MTPKPSWLVALLLLCPLGAQDEAAKPVDAKTRLQQLQAEQQEHFEAWREKMRKEAEEARNNPDKPRPRSIALRPDYGPMRGKYLAAADEYPADGALFLMAALAISSSPEQYREIIDRLLDGHLDADATGQLGGNLAYLERMVSPEYAAEVVAKIKAHGKNATLMAWLAFNEHEQTFRSEAPASAAFQNAKAVVAAAVGKASDVRLQRTWDQLITETEKFGLGMTAPDIVGIDLDGVSFKLSDYKGKVIFLDFWGDW